MLKMRQPQMDALADYTFTKFVNEMMKHLRAAFPDQAGEMPEPALRDLILNGVASCESYGIHREYDVERYLELLFVMGPNFDATPETSWAGALLRDTAMTPGERLNRIALRLEEER